MNEITTKLNYEPQQNSTGHKMLYWVSIIPYLIITYVQLAYNLLIVIVVSNWIYKFVNVIEYDLEKYIDKKAHIALLKVLECTNNFVQNKCGDKFLPPALTDICLDWRYCMETDINYTIKSKETAEIFAEILNNFFENLSNKTLYCVIGFFVVFIIIFNLSLNWSRQKYKYN
jgi:hypothetical protein